MRVRTRLTTNWSSAVFGCWVRTFEEDSLRVEESRDSATTNQFWLFGRIMDGPYRFSDRKMGCQMGLELLPGSGLLSFFDESMEARIFSPRERKQRKDATAIATLDL